MVPKALSVRKRALMAQKNNIKPIPLTNIASSTVSGTYAAINSSGLANPCFLIRIINNSTQDVTVSYDGVNDHEFVPKATTVAVTGQANVPQFGTFSAFTVVYVKGTAGTGNIYLSGYYQPQGV